MQKVLIDVTQHPSARPAVKKRALQPLWVTPALRGGDGRVRDGDLEEDGCFFVGHDVWVMSFEVNASRQENFTWILENRSSRSSS